jgi:signal transduction histidine kinase
MDEIHCAPGDGTIPGGRFLEGPSVDENLRNVFFLVEHELRTPVAVALMQLNIVEHAVRGTVPMERAPALLAGAKRQLGGMLQVLRRMIELQRRGRVELNRQTVDLGNLAGDLTARLCATNQPLWSRVELRADEGVIGSWDPVAMEQIIENLLSNALKFGKDLPVHLTVSGRRGGACISVRDHGDGVTREDRARIFELYGRADSAHNTAGSGIGLWVVRHLVDAHEGRIRLISRQGVGTLFHVWLPGLVGPSAPPP